MFRPAKVKAEAKAVAEQVKIAEAPLNVAPIIPRIYRGGIRITEPVTKAFIDSLGIDHSLLANLLVDSHTQYLPVDCSRGPTANFLPAASYVYRLGSKALSKSWSGLDIEGYGGGVLGAATLGIIMPSWFPTALQGQVLPHLYFDYYDYGGGLEHEQWVIYSTGTTLYFRQYHINTLMGGFVLDFDNFTLAKYLTPGVEPSPPAAAEAYRGRMVRQEGAVGFKDKTLQCKKLSDETFAWLRQLDELDIGGGGVRDITITAPASAALAWANMPALETELYSRTIYRIKADLINASQMRLMVNIQVAGAEIAKLRAQYGLTYTGQFFSLDGATGPSVDINVGTTLLVSDWVNIVDAAKTDVFLRVVGINGDGATDPSFGHIMLQVK